MFYQGVQHTTASDASVASLVEPLTSTLLAALIFGEQLGALGLLGVVLLIGAIVFLHRNGSDRSGTNLTAAAAEVEFARSLLQDGAVVGRGADVIRCIKLPVAREDPRKWLPRVFSFSASQFLGTCTTSYDPGGRPKRALTAYSREPNRATVVGTSKPGSVMVRSTVPEA